MSKHRPSTARAIKRVWTRQPLRALVSPRDVFTMPADTLTEDETGVLLTLEGRSIRIPWANVESAEYA